MSETDRLLENAARLDPLPPGPKGAKVAVVTCMDARIDVYRLLGLERGVAHVIRNAGAAVGDEEIRSLSISQHMLGSREVLVIAHTGCGMLAVDDEEFASRMEREAGRRPPFPARGFSDLEEHVRAGVRAVRESPFVPHTDSVRGFVYDLDADRLAEVDVP